MLRTLSARYPDVSMHGDDILGVAKPHMNVTIEPAAQLEISAGPFESIADMRFALGEFERDVAAALTPVAGRMVALGYDPMLVAADKELIPKARYDIMNRYLSAISPSGPHMMRGSASTQVSIDYTSEEDAAAKMRVASALAPLLSLMCDNAPVFEGTRAPHRLMRCRSILPALTRRLSRASSSDRRSVRWPRRSRAWMRRMWTMRRRRS